LAVITALRATRRGLVALHVDGAKVCTVSESFVARWRLFKGRELDAESLAQIVEEASVGRCLADAHRLLGHRSRSRAELRARLLAKEHSEQAVAGVLDALQSDGLLDDVAFARSFVADKRRLSGWGTERIRRGLSALGVDEADAEAALHGPAEDGAAEELDRALAVLRKLGPPRPPLDAARRRAYQTLLRRGYNSGVAYAAIRRWSEGGAFGGSSD
jgi:regulatory protein